VGLTTVPSSCAGGLEIGEPQPPGTLRACPGLLTDCFPFTFTLAVWSTELRHTMFFSRMGFLPPGDEGRRQQNQWRTQEFCSWGGGSTYSVEDRENGELGVVTP